MAYNEALTEKLREAFSHIPNVEEKKMFRGVSFMVNGKICASAGDDEYMFHIDPTVHAESLKKKGIRTMTMKGREYKGYIMVKEDSVKTKAEMDYWVNLALDFNKKLKASKK